MADTTTTQRRLRFERLVREAEASIAADPRAYRLRIVGLALLGYGVLFGAAALLLALVSGAVWGALASTAFLLLLLKKKLIIPLLAVVWVILRSLWVRIEAPTGYPARRAEFPALHDEMQALRRQLKTPPVHEIILTEDFNAAVAQTPRLGVLGWNRNSVILGLPLLLALTPEQARAVLAHEFGHLSGNHSQFSAWIYRLRLTWYRVMLAFDQAHGFSTVLLRRFFDWYAPYFNACSFALARGNEYEADAISARLTSVKDAAHALVSTHIRSDHIQEVYWRPLLKRAEASPEPETRPFSGLARFLRESAPPREELLERIRKAVSVETDHANTHPALRDRLSALNAPPVLPGSIGRSAADAWLGPRLPAVLAAFDRDWLERNREAWQQRFDYVQKARGELAQLAARPSDQLTHEERWNLATWTEEFASETDALPLYRAFAQHAPDDRDADFVIGRILLERDNPEGLVHLERAMEEFRHALPACELACDYFHRAGDRNQVDLWRRRGERFIDVANHAQAEREALSVGDTFLRSDLQEAEHQLLRDQLAAFEHVKHAWIAKKQLKHLREHPLYVVAVTPSGLLTNADKLIEDLAEKVDTQAMTYFVATEGDSSAVGKKVAKAGTQLI
jgi:Zn-dependent protease with chaperone function